MIVEGEYHWVKMKVDQSESMFIAERLNGRWWITGSDESICDSDVVAVEGPLMPSAFQKAES